MEKINKQKKKSKNIHKKKQLKQNNKWVNRENKTINKIMGKTNYKKQQIYIKFMIPHKQYYN